MARLLTFQCLLSVSLLLQVVKTQFPESCLENATLPGSTCCPRVTEDSTTCGYPTRGICAPADQSSQFLRSCFCFGNFFGPGCQRCLYGFDDSSGCSKKLPLSQRRDVTAVGDQLTRLELAVNRSRTTGSPYFIIDPENGEPSNATWMEYLQYLYQSAPSEGPGFLTWNRLFLLEAEVAFGELENRTFAVPFWDWTNGAVALKKVDAEIDEISRTCTFPRPEQVENCLSVSEYDPDPLEISPASMNLSFWRCVQSLHIQVLRCFNVTTASAFPQRPIPYFLHVTFLDKIFSTWLSRYQQSILAYPRISKYPGQSLYDPIRPFNLSISHAAMLTDTAALGYTYEGGKGVDPASPLWLVGIILCVVSALLTLVLVITVQFKVGDGKTKKKEEEAPAADGR